MIRDAVLHLASDQPLLVDLYERPAAVDVVLICTNIRTMSGTRPVWIDDSASAFFFPFSIVRFLEIHPGTEEEAALPGRDDGARRAPRPPRPGEPEADLEIDEDFLRRVREV
jgi:hypothetical protein